MSKMAGTSTSGVDVRPQEGPAAGLPSEHFRYPGSLSFQDNELDHLLFCGRRQEATETLHTILSSDLTVVYGPSGVGKTSLLNAGIMQQLRDRRCWPVSVRLNDPGKDLVVSIHEQIDEAGMKDASVEIEVAPGCAEVVDRSLWDLLTSLEVWRGNDLEELVLVLDQFEELFNLDWPPEERARFARSLGDIVRGRRSTPEHFSHTASSKSRPRVRLVVMIREDSLGYLEAMAQDVPSIFDSRYRLGPLSVTCAEAALVEPAAVNDDRLVSQRFRYSKDALDGILTFLSAEGGPLGAAREMVIDPSQLQLVCQYVETTIVPNLAPAADGLVQLADLGGPEGLEPILREFYRRTIASLPEERREVAQGLCERGLISQRGRRLSLEQGEIEMDYGVTPEDLKCLVDSRLLRPEYRPRLRSHYYELAHDKLVEPILAERDARRLRALGDVEQNRQDDARDAAARHQRRLQDQLEGAKSVVSLPVDGGSLVGQLERVARGQSRTDMVRLGAVATFGELASQPYEYDVARDAYEQLGKIDSRYPDKVKEAARVALQNVEAPFAERSTSEFTDSASRLQLYLLEEGSRVDSDRVEADVARLLGLSDQLSRWGSRLFSLLEPPIRDSFLETVYQLPDLAADLRATGYPIEADRVEETQQTWSSAERGSLPVDEAIGKGPSPPGWLLYGTQALLSLLAVVLAEALSVWWLHDLGRPSSGALTWALIVYSVLAVLGGLSLELIVDPDVPTSRRLGSAFWWFVLVLLLWLAVTVESSMISEFFSISFFLVLWIMMVLALILGCIAWLFLALWLDEEW